MNRVRKMVNAVVPAVALLLITTPAALAYEQLPIRAAQLNAGTAATGIDSYGEIGGAISAVIPDPALGAQGTEVAGAQTAADVGEGGVMTHSTLGDAAFAALLNAGTSYTGVGPHGQVGDGITGAAPVTREVAGVMLAPSGYVAQLRFWNSAGYRVQPNNVWLSSLTREDSTLPAVGAGVEVAGIQQSYGDSATGYAERLRLFTSEGYRVQPSYVNTSALVND